MQATQLDESFGEVHPSFSIMYAPYSLPTQRTQTWIFLAGSIDGGQAEAWQASVARQLAMYPVTLLNPRRAIWPRGAEQRIDNPIFREQVQWELAALEQADLIMLYFAPDSQAPISLLEFGLHARSKKLLVACPEQFWRRGNVEIVCQHYDIPCYETLEALVQAVIQLIRPSEALGRFEPV